MIFIIGADLLSHKIVKLKPTITLYISVYKYAVILLMLLQLQLQRIIFWKVFSNSKGLLVTSWLY